MWYTTEYHTQKPSVMTEEVYRGHEGGCMPKGPQGQKRPADAIGCAIIVAKIATGEIEEELKEPSGRVRSGKAGGKARAAKLAKRKRSGIAKKAAAARWK